MAQIVFYNNIYYKALISLPINIIKHRTIYLNFFKINFRIKCLEDN